MRKNGANLGSEHAVKGYTGTTNLSAMQSLLEQHTTFIPQKRQEKPPSSSCPKYLGILGSTGFLGPYIVAFLLQEHPQCEVICVNRSNNGEQRTMSALEDILGDTSVARSRLTFLVHDIAGRDKGLYHGPVLERLSQVDELVFNAWDTNWGKPLDAFAPLLEALRRIVDLLAAAPGRPRITFVSSICAVGSWPLLHPEQPMIPEEVIPDCCSAMPNGYGESKCVAEQLLAKAHEATKLRINILRVSQIGGPQDAKHCLWPRQGWLYSIIGLSKRLGAFPEHVQAIDWIPVDALAHAVANCLKPSPASDSLQVFNMVHPQPAAWSLFHEILSAKFGIPAQTIDLPSWLDRIKDGDLRIQKFLRAQGRGRETNLSFVNVRALKALPPISRMNAELLEAWLQGWKLGPIARL